MLRMSHLTYFFLINIFLVVFVLLSCALFYFFFYIYGKKRLHSIKFNPSYPDKKTIKLEIKLTLFTICSFLFWSLVTYVSYLENLNLLYTSWDDYGLIYLVMNIFLIAVVHDAYFYWLHRWQHHRSGKWMNHTVHHTFVNPTPFATLAVNIKESIVHMFFYCFITFIIPINLSVLILYLVISHLLSIIGHNGYNISNLPSQYFINAKDHYNHHKYVGGNFGLYFQFWDRWCKTQVKK